jgi:hypothetical protein
MKPLRPCDEILAQMRAELVCDSQGRLFRRGKRVDNAPTANGYLRVSFGGKQYYAHRVAWFLQRGEWPALLIDHIDGNKKFNAGANLRLATVAQNGANRPAKAGKTAKGVRFVKGRYRAHITVEGRSKFLGSFDTEALASEAYAEAATRAFGEFANTSIRASEAFK